MTNYPTKTIDIVGREVRVYRFTLSDFTVTRYHPSRGLLAWVRRMLGRTK
jgi:hypothetical protein